ncbi:hypothetical protein U1Q18_046020 [Sarracenia purpurea var. burkii]
MTGTCSSSLSNITFCMGNIAKLQHALEQPPRPDLPAYIDSKTSTHWQRNKDMAAHFDYN